MRLSSFIWIVSSFWAFGVQSQELLKETKLDSVSVLFESGSFVVKKPDVILAGINGMEKQALGKIVLVGYTDSVGNLKSNQLLASKRLQSVWKLLQESQFKDYIVDSLNRNESRGKETFDDNQFRRVDILIYKLEPNFVLGKPFNLHILFVAGSDYVESGSIKSLKKLLDVLKSDDSLTIKLNGHVCCNPNQVMSLKRAQRVKSYLVEHGIDEKRITCFGYSNNVKLVQEISPQTQATNRRVEVVFLKN
ncbi:Outer membrane porin F precursor [compost metagenome]